MIADEPIYSITSKITTTPSLFKKNLRNHPGSDKPEIGKIA